MSIYIAGYAVECGLKALILSSVPKARREALVESFRGNRAHNFNWLIELYNENGGARRPLSITKDLAFVHDEWSVNLRYVAGEKPFREAERFILSTERILEWIEGRL